MFNTPLQSATDQGKEKALSGMRNISKKQKVKYTSVFVLLLILPIVLLYFHLIENTCCLYMYLQIYALFLGIIHVWQMQKRFGWINQYTFPQKLSLTLIIISIAYILQVLVLFSFFYLEREITPFYLMFPTCVFVFVFPLIAVTTFDYSYSIPKAIYKTWKYPTNINMPDLDMIDFSNSYIVTFEFKKSVGDFKNTTMKFKAPPDKLSFGDLFYLYLFEYNEKNRESSIQVIDERNQTFQWLFHIKSDSWFGDKKYVDTALTVRENKIKENDVIIAERV